ncbi:MAG: AmmeMemoRadiSam system protein B [Proteobacteria bacterium]|nr:AmmeMemoRadiSam system protein B [Pseudomonadota bacterium]
MKPHLPIAALPLLAALLLSSNACQQCQSLPQGAPTQGDTVPDTQAESRVDSATAPPRIEGALAPQVADVFYPGDPQELAQFVTRALAAATPRPDLATRDIVGIVAPHAGYVYSGAVAAEAWSLVQHRDIRLVVLLAFHHRRPNQGAALPTFPGMRTPLGDIPVDTDAASALVADAPALFSRDDKMFHGEHSLETQLPFVQTALPQARILPIMVGFSDAPVIEAIGETLFAHFGDRRDVLFAASSDMSHFYTHEEAARIDDATLTHLAAQRFEPWLQHASAHQSGMCGVRPLYAFVSLFARYPAEARQVDLLQYRTSGDVSGDRQRVVGYAALGFSLDAEQRKQVPVEKNFGPFTKEARRALMDIAKTSVKNATQGRTAPVPKPALPLLAEPGAAFVTLRIDGQLRGCVGHVLARDPLYRCVDDVARSAAIHDSRFAPLTPAEYPRVDFEISVLTAPAPIRPEDVEVGKHGLIISRGAQSGLLLPQVPIEWNWNREEFLSATCRKAGLPPNCWQSPGVELRAFSAIVFDESDT